MDHLFHKNLLAEKHNLEWQLAQANIKIKNLEEQLNRVKRQTVLSEEIGVPNVPPLPKPTPQPMPQPLPLPDESRPVPMPRVPGGKKFPQPMIDDFFRWWKKKIFPMQKNLGEGGGNQITENIERNIAECIFENRNFIIQNMIHNSPNLFENRQIDSEVATKILYVVMEDIMSDEDFILQNYKVLGAPTLTEDARNVIMERFGLGKFLGKIIRKVAGYFGGGKKVIPPPQTPGDPLVRIGPKGTDYERIIRPEDIR